MAGDKKLAQAIAEVIAEHGRSQSDVAKALGHTPAWLNRIVRGERGIKSPDLVALAEELGVDVGDFYDRGVAPRRIAEGNAEYLPTPLVAVPVVDQEASASLRPRHPLRWRSPPTRRIPPVLTIL